MRIKKEYMARDVIGYTKDIDEDKYVVPIKEFAHVLKRHVEEDLKLIALLEEHGDSVYMPIRPFIDELNLYAREVKLTAQQRLCNIVDMATDGICLKAHHYGEPMIKTKLSDKCRELIANIELPTWASNRNMMNALNRGTTSCMDLCKELKKDNK